MFAARLLGSGRAAIDSETRGCRRRHSGARQRREPGIQKRGNPFLSGFRVRRSASSRN